MDSKAQSQTEIEVLRSLCDPSISLENRQTLARAMAGHIFTEPEHQVVFESIRALLAKGRITATQLQVHLTNRGFPDTDIDKYFEAARTGARTPRAPSDKLEP